jgi:hypothetical protein
MILTSIVVRVESLTFQLAEGSDSIDNSDVTERGSASELTNCANRMRKGSSYRSPPLSALGVETWSCSLHHQEIQEMEPASSFRDNRIRPVRVLG